MGYEFTMYFQLILIYIKKTIARIDNMYFVFMLLQFACWPLLVAKYGNNVHESMPPVASCTKNEEKSIELRRDKKTECEFIRLRRRLGYHDKTTAAAAAATGRNAISASWGAIVCRLLQMMWRSVINKQMKPALNGDRQTHRHGHTERQGEGVKRGETHLLTCLIISRVVSFLQYCFRLPRFCRLKCLK